MNWILEELQLARPKVVITLGSEVAGILQHVGGQTQRNELLGGDINEFCAGYLLHPPIFWEFRLTVFRSSDMLVHVYGYLIVLRSLTT
jgi:hypothetical protein